MYTTPNRCVLPAIDTAVSDPPSGGRRCAALLLWLVAGVATHLAQADELVTEEREVADFTAVSFAGSGELHISQTGEESLVIQAEAPVLDVITTEVKDGVLRIGRKRGSWVRSRHPVRYDLTVASLASLRVSGSGDVVVGRVQGGDFELTISGSSDVSVAALDVGDLNVTLSGSGDLEIAELNGAALVSRISGSGEIAASGTVESQRVAINGSGDHLAAELKSRAVEARVTGSGDVDVWVTEELTATVRGSGDIYYRGDAQVSSRISGSGEVRSRAM